ncbi:30S ribosome-binding factor RbfA [Spongiibacter taiwanensis]|uniref:30S ribosome-binding factor RbfA n=1 Tax=Spongiibacter taiwanensis TaxID=1748242 RepID=UPI0020355AB6|nr:30S ribosome-binding factor RbfA [Spongiibacter taiwanensis]USA42415.1 30S ribosome-binding factor RbfA [Spongiibacter taiwanensis]
MKEFSRTARIADFLKRELGTLIQLQLRDPRLGMVSVTDVEVSRDLSHAKVFVTVMGKNTAEEAKDSVAVLNKAAGFLRSQVAKINNARTTPQLRFYYDASIDRGQRLSKLIQDAVDADRSRHQDDGES